MGGFDGLATITTNVRVFVGTYVDPTTITTPPTVASAVQKVKYSFSGVCRLSAVNTPCRLAKVARFEALGYEYLSPEATCASFLVAFSIHRQGATVL